MVIYLFGEGDGYVLITIIITFHCSRACGTEVGDHYIVTGGFDDTAPESTLTTVAKYSQSGLVEYLPSLNQRRQDHACSSFISDDGETVGFA